jgi:hypothetical protein
MSTNANSSSAYSRSGQPSRALPPPIFLVSLPGSLLTPDLNSIHTAAVATARAAAAHIAATARVATTHVAATALASAAGIAAATASRTT